MYILVGLLNNFSLSVLDNSTNEVNFLVKIDSDRWNISKFTNKVVKMVKYNRRLNNKIS